MEKPSITEMDEFLYSFWNFFAANLSSRTAKNYYNVIKNYIKLTGKTPLELTLEDSIRFNEHLLEKVKSGRLSYQTALMRISVMRSLCEYIRLRQNKLNIDYTNYFNDIILPDVDKTINADYLPSAIEINTLLQYIKNANDEMTYLILSLVAKCGLKSSEVCQLALEYLVFDKQGNLCVKFPAKRKITRIIRIPNDITELVLNYINSNSITEGPLFFNKHHTQLKVRDAERLIKKYIGSAGINNQFTLQQLRHAAVKYMLQGGASEENVAKYCGITTKWMSRYIQVVDRPDILDTANLSVISIKNFT